MTARKYDREALALACERCGGGIEVKTKGPIPRFCSKHCQQPPIDHIERRYGLSAEEYEMLTTSGCHACGSYKRLCVDHDHTTGQVRGALCSPCNMALGLLKDSPQRAIDLAAYIAGKGIVDKR